MLVNLDIFNDNVLSCLFLFFLIIDLYFLLPTVRERTLSMQEKGEGGGGWRVL